MLAKLPGIRDHNLIFGTYHKNDRLVGLIGAFVIMTIMVMTPMTATTTMNIKATIIVALGPS